MDSVDTPKDENIQYQIYSIITDRNFWRESNPFDFKQPPIDPVFLSNSLVSTMDRNNGIALSAPQVGLNFRVFCLRGIDSALFNPIIVDRSNQHNVMEEFSLSYPNLVVKIRRPNAIRIRYTDAFGQTDTHYFSGLTARTILRKIDFLDGKLFYQHASKFHLDQARRKADND